MKVKSTPNRLCKMCYDKKNITDFKLKQKTLKAQIL